MERDEMRQSIADFQEEFRKHFPDRDALRVASQFCNVVLQSKMTKLLEKHFAFREPSELIAILEYIHGQTKRASQDEKRPGRPRKPRPDTDGTTVPDGTTLAS